MDGPDLGRKEVSWSLSTLTVELKYRFLKRRRDLVKVDNWEVYIERMLIEIKL